MAKFNYIAMDASGKEVRGYMNSDAELARDQDIGISFKKTGVFVFDFESGERYL